MIFLNPAILWGLFAVSIPIIIHIFNLKRTKKIEFSTLMFLKEIQQSKYKRVKLKQLLILLCRIAFVILLILAFSRPFEKGYLFSGGSKARSSVLLVLDDSFSMLNREVQSSDFEVAKTKLLETLDLFDENDEIYFSTVSDLGKSDKNYFYKDINALKDTVKNLKVSDITKDINTVIYFSGRVLEASTNPVKEIFVYTDGQKTFFSGSAASDNIKLSENTKLNIILAGNRKGNNLSIDSVDIKTKIFEKNKPVKIKCTVSNHNSFNVSNKSIILTARTRNIRDEKVIDIPANSTVDVEFSLIPGINGFVSGIVELLQKEISEDEIANDNKQYFAFYVPQKIKVLLVSETPGELAYLKLALQSSEEMMKDSSGSKAEFYEINQIGSADFNREKLTNYDCVVITDKPAFNSDEAKKIKEYINNGGGVIIYPGEKTQIESYNNTLFKEIDVPFILSRYTSAENNPVYKFDNADLNHAIFDGLFLQKGNPKESFLKDSPEIKSGYEIVTGKNSEAVITLNGNKNFLVEYSLGKGKLLMYSVPPDMSFSNYPSKTIFSPVTVRSILYISEIGMVKPAVTGKEYFVDITSLIPAKPDTGTITMSPVSGAPETKLRFDQSGTVVNFKSYLNSNSIYSLRYNQGIVMELPANFDRKESLLDKYNTKEINKLLKESLRLEANIINPESPISSSVNALRSGKEIWQYLLIFALMFLLIEYLIARTIKS